MGAAPPPLYDDGVTDPQRQPLIPLPAHAPPPPAPAPTPYGVDTGEAHLLSMLRLLRAEVQDLSAVLEQIRRGEAPMARFTEYIADTREQVRSIIVDIRSTDDCVRRIQNAWEQLETCALIRDPETVQDAQLQIQCINLLQTQCRQIIYWCSYRTIPNRLSSWLRDTQPGFAIPFHTVFEDELPEPEDRQRILNYLALAPNVLKAHGGMVDPDAGLIYRYEPDPWKRLGSLALVAIAMIAATAAIVGANIAVPAPAGEGGARILLIGWIAVLAGTLVHIGVGTAKRARTAGNPVILPVRRFTIMVNAREGFILLRIFMALLGYLAYAYGTGMAEGLPLQSYMFSAFLVGYSLDSVVELFGAGLDQRAAAQGAVFRKRMGLQHSA
jgi:hypothetical protein